MGKAGTAARYARASTYTRKISSTKIRNKSRQKTPKAVRRQLHNTKLQKEWQKSTKTTRKKLKSLSWNSFKTDLTNEYSNNKSHLKNGNNSDPQKPKFSKSDRRKYQQQQKRLAKQQTKRGSIDFSTYDRNINEADILSSSSDSDADRDADADAVADSDQNPHENNANRNKNPNADTDSEEDDMGIAQKQSVNILYDDDYNDATEASLLSAEQKHFSGPQSYDQRRKSRLPFRDSAGNWIQDNDNTVQNQMYRDFTQYSDMKDNEVNDYLNLTNLNKGDNDNDNDNDNHGDDAMDESDSDLEEEEEQTIVESPESNGSTSKLKSKSQPKLSVQGWRLKKKIRSSKLKLEIAEMCENILQDPYRNSGLLALLLELTTDTDIEICQLAMLSLCKAIIDVMPTYKIGTLESNPNLKKGTERVRVFEKHLLESYQLFLKSIFKLAAVFHSNIRRSTKRRDPKRFILGRCAIKCTLLFIRKCSHFNYTKELIKNAIPLMNCPVTIIRRQACDSISVLLSQEPINNVTVECVQMIAAKIEQRNFDVCREMIDSFLALSLQHLEPPAEDKEAQEAEAYSNRNKTKSKWEKRLEKKIEKQMKAMDGSLDKKKQFSRQKVIVEAIFGVYFYVLKLEVHHRLLAPVLAGMAKYSHLVNVEIVLDLISVVSEKLENESCELSMVCKLNCILTTFRLLSARGSASSIEMDVKQHYITIYELLLSVANNMYEWKYFLLIFDCLVLMFDKQIAYQLSVERIASFVKRLINLSMQLPPHISICCLHFARRLILNDARLYNMLDYEGGYDRDFNKYETNCDYANSLACCLWELTEMSLNFHPFCKHYSRDISTWSEISPKLHTMQIRKLYRQYDCGLPITQASRNEEEVWRLSRQDSQRPSNQRNNNTNSNDAAQMFKFRPFVKESNLTRFSIAKHPPKDIQTVGSEWFVGHNNEYRLKKHRLQNLKRRIIAGNQSRSGSWTKNSVKKTVKYVLECKHERQQNMILRELNDEYKFLSQQLFATD